MLPSEARAACAGAGAALAVYLAVHPSSNGSGLRRQVERRLELRLRPLRAYAVWGAELGSGWSTLIPYSAFLLLLAIELRSGPLLGAAAGAAFGLSRQAPAVLAARIAESPASIMPLLPQLAPRMRLANLIVCLVGGTALAAEVI